MSTLTRLLLDPRVSSVRRKLSSEQVVHAVVQAAVEGQEGRSLWRVDPGQQAHTMLLLSAEVPNVEHLAREFGVSPAQVESRSYEPLLSRLAVGQEWRLKLRANATVARPREGRSSSRHALRREPDQIDWFLSRAAKWGLSIPTNRLGVPELVVARSEELAFRRTGSTVTLGAVTFDGVGRVTDVELLRHALIQGIGSAKAYGCGLMTLAPV